MLKPFSLRAENSEIAAWKKAAAGNLSEWVRSVLNSAAAGNVAVNGLTAEMKGRFEGQFVGRFIPDVSVVEFEKTITVERQPIDDQQFPSIDDMKEESPNSLVEQARKKSKRKNTCDHGQPRGHHCGLCGGKAKVK